MATLTIKLSGEKDPLGKRTQRYTGARTCPGPARPGRLCGGRERSVRGKRYLLTGQVFLQSFQLFLLALDLQLHLGGGLAGTATARCPLGRRVTATVTIFVRSDHVFQRALSFVRSTSKIKGKSRASRSCEKTKLVFKGRTSLPLGNSDETHLRAACTQPRRRVCVRHARLRPGRARHNPGLPARFSRGHPESTRCGCSIFALRRTKNDRRPTDGGAERATKPIAPLRFFGRVKFIFRNLFQNLGHPHIHTIVFPFRVLLGHGAKEGHGRCLGHPAKLDGTTQTNQGPLADLC